MNFLDLPPFKVINPNLIKLTKLYRNPLVWYRAIFLEHLLLKFALVVAIFVRILTFLTSFIYSFRSQKKEPVGKELETFVNIPRRLAGWQVVIKYGQGQDS